MESTGYLDGSTAPRIQHDGRESPPSIKTVIKKQCSMSNCPGVICRACRCPSKIPSILATALKFRSDIAPLCCCGTQVLFLGCARLLQQTKKKQFVAVEGTQTMPSWQDCPC